MGTLALESSLDTAVHILDYRLSRATSPAVSEIFKYRIALLRTKISKTYKKVSSVVSPSCYSVLSVDTMDCDSDCSVPSKGVPAKGSVLDVKSSVLNS